MRRCLRQSIVLAAWAVACGAALAWAAPPSSAPASQPAIEASSATLDNVLAKLSSDDWKQRQQAADSLATLDPAVIPRLRKIVDSTTDVDLRNSLLAAIRTIDERDQIGPTLVTLHAKNAPAIDVLKSLAVQLRFDLVCENTEWLNDARVTISADHEPFWSVMKKLEPQCALRVTMLANDPARLMLQSIGNDYLTERAVVAGPFLICPVAVSCNSSADLLQPGAPVKFRNVSITMLALPEPKLRATRISVAVKEAVDENGKSLIVPDLNGRVFTQFAMSTPMTQTAIRLNPPAQAGKKIARLTGTVTCRVPTRTRRVEVANAFDGKSHSVDLSGRTVSVTVVTRDKFYDVKMAIPANVSIQDEISQSQTRDLNLLDAAGNRLYRRTLTQTMTGRNWELTVTFSRDGVALGRPDRASGEPVKLVWDLPVETKEMQTPFELLDIPLLQ